VFYAIIIIDTSPPCSFGCGLLKHLGFMMQHLCVCAFSFKLHCIFTRGNGIFCTSRVMPSFGFTTLQCRSCMVFTPRYYTYRQSEAYYVIICTCDVRSWPCKVLKCTANLQVFSFPKIRAITLRNNHQLNHLYIVHRLRVTLHPKSRLLFFFDLGLIILSVFF